MPSRTYRTLLDAVTPESIDELSDALSHMPAATRGRGERYIEENRVSELWFEGNAVSGFVRGTHRYTTRWSLEGGADWWSECACPMQYDCKHAYAVGRIFVEIAVPALTGILPRTDTRSTNRPARSVRAPDFLATFRDTRSPYERRTALERLLALKGARPVALYGPAWEDILAEPSPDLRCWRAARELRLDGGALPDALEPFRAREDLAERFRETRRPAALAQLSAWTARHAHPARALIRVEVDARPMGDGVSLHVYARATSARLSDEPRTQAQLRQMLSPASSASRSFSAEEAALVHHFAFDPIGQALSTTQCARPVAGADLLRFLIGFPDSPLVRWAASLAPEVAARAGIRAGDVVRLGRGSLRLEPSVSDDGGKPSIRVAYTGSDARWHPPETMRRVHDPPGLWGATRQPLAIGDGAVWMVVDTLGPADRDLLREAGEVTLTAAECASLLPALAAAFPACRAALAGRTRTHPVTPVVLLDLGERDDLCLRLVASTDPSWRPNAAPTREARIFEWDERGAWVRVDAPGENGPRMLSLDCDGDEPVVDLRNDAPAADAAPAAGISDPGISDPDVRAAQSIWLEFPDAAAVRPLVEWVERAGTTPRVETGPGRFVRLTGKAGERFAAAWDERPTNATYYATPRARRLLVGGARVVPRLRVTASGVDWLSVSAEWEAEGLRLTDADLALLRRARTPFVKLPGGWVRRDVAAAHDRAADALATLGVLPGAGEQRVSLWQVAQAGADGLAALEALGAGAETLSELRRLRDAVAAFQGVPRVDVPRGITANLRPYQRDGVDVLVYASTLGLGTVLADDMGLGKTVQALVWLSWLIDRDPAGGPSLVACPASVLHNWQREAARFAPDLRVLVRESGSERHARSSEIARHDLVVTNYALLRRDSEDLAAVEWRALILDEAQMVKNPDADVSRAARELRARHRLALTGTPLENRALDLWSIMACVNPGYLGPRPAFERRFGALDAPPPARRLLAARLRPVMLRRLKEQVARDLPPRIEERRDCEMTPGQRALYLAELARGRAAIERLAMDRAALQRNHITILALLTRLRQICCHPALVGGRVSLGSGKFDALFELLEPLLAEGHKVLVFSQFVECLKRVATALTARGIPHHMLTGQTAKRGAVVDRFMSDERPSVFLVSLRAGGTGLNLTAASYVVLLDPWWNPAVEAQAIDRTHRIGQDRTVIAYRLIAAGTVEEKIWEMQRQKAALARDVLGEEGFARALTREDLQWLFAEEDVEVPPGGRAR